VTPEYIDIHTHILPGIDDGAKTLEESLEIIGGAKKAGFSTMVATPHKIETVYDPTDKIIRDSMAALNEHEQRWDKLKIISGVEYYMDDRFFHLLERGSLICLGDSKTVLVELPMMHMPPFAIEYPFKIRLKGYTPLLAHPERYNYIISKPKAARDLVEKGFLLQANLGSFAGIYGRRVAKTARRLLKDGLYTVAASDIHSAKNIRGIYQDGLARLKKAAGERLALDLLYHGPLKLLERT